MGVGATVALLGWSVAVRVGEAESDISGAEDAKATVDDSGVELIWGVSELDRETTTTRKITKPPMP